MSYHAAKESKRTRKALRATLVATLAVSVGVIAPAHAGGLIRDAETEALLRAYAKPIVSAAGLGSQGIRIHIVNDRNFNAFVVDGQNMFIHAGALMNAKTPNQMIGVIAHESGHITGGHLARLRNADLPGQVGGPDAAAPRPCRHGGRRACRRRRYRAGAAWALLSAGRTPRCASVLAYRQNEESSADQAAITFLNATKQSGRGMLETFEFMASKLIGVQGINPYLQTPPAAAAAHSAASRARACQPYYDNVDPPELQIPPRLGEGEAVRLPGQARYGVQSVIRRPTSPCPRSMRVRSPPTGASGVQAAMPQLNALIACQPDWPYFHEIKGQFLFESGKLCAGHPAVAGGGAARPGEPLIRIMLAQALVGSQQSQICRRGDHQSPHRSCAGRRLFHGISPARRRLCAEGRSRAGNGRQDANTWRKPSLHPPKPISMKGT